MGKPRHAKGINFVEVIKTLKVHRREHTLDGLSDDARALLDERILVNQWYPFGPFVEYLDYVYDHLLQRDPEKCFEMGVHGATVQLTGAHRGYVVRGDAEASVMSLRHIWPTYFDFGEVKAKLDTTSASVLFTYAGYPDMKPSHAYTIPAWSVVAARLSGSKDASFEILEMPWRDGSEFAYRVSF